MPNNHFKLTIAHLYPKLLNIYGDVGNIIAFKKRCEWRGIDVEVVNINKGDSVKPGVFDIYFIGGGQDEQQKVVSKELLKQRDVLYKEADAMAVFLGICGGYQLLGEYYQPNESEKLFGVHLLDVVTVAGEKRFIGNVTVKCDFTGLNTLVGFENHSGLTYLSGATKPIGKVLVGNGNNGEDGAEGARKRNVFGTYLHGSFLPKNPHFTDYLIKLALDRKYGTDVSLKKLEDTLELVAHNSCVNKKY